ncbi:AAA family ATPase [Pseudanabaena sp. FACHB-1998]|uniref:NB-ARC domain-containing protein n=1 Tax=Pseudanabaena sp. FACHB-1998 TaxID=2692858 RepID=UPI001680FE68|nr:NB-ARC domain-containing protein [Pseudanabaena sp. FACHB-1998]MBD2178466.1 AAA family ATPase [Pseudanabaena sp. FACHB-1998]
MTIEDALAVVDAALQQKRLSNIQEQLFRQTWEGKTYAEIAEMCGYDSSYIRDVGYRLWQMLTKGFGERVTKHNLQVVVRTHAKRFQDSVESQQSAHPHKSLSIVNPHNHAHNSVQPVSPTPSKRCDWGNAIDTSIFYGRIEELATVKDWVVSDRCRLLGVFGIGGIGKTAFATKLAEQVQGEFTLIAWRSLRNAPKIEVLLADLVSFLTNQAIANLPQDLNSLQLMFIQVLQQSRCLIVLDNVESILRSGETTGQYSEGYEGYGELFRQVGEVRHQSCLILTSREKPADVLPPDISDRMVRSLQLTGLKEEALQMFQPKLAIAPETRKLIDFYCGNPLALTVVSRSINSMFDGNVQDFLDQEANVFGDIRNLVDQQYARLSPLEQQVMHWLAIEREPITTDNLRQDIVPMVSKSQILESVFSLRWRSLIEKKANSFTQQPVMMEYMTDRLIESAYQAAIERDPEFLMSYALVQHRAEDYIRETQIRYILQPLTDRLLAHYGSAETLQRELHELLETLRDHQTAIGYAQSNIMNLLKASKTDLSKSFSRFPERVTESSDLKILGRLLESDRAGGLATWDHRIPWANNPLAQQTSESKTQIRSKNLYYQWTEGSLEQLQQELKQQPKMRKQYHAWLNETEFAAIDADFEAVQITDTLNQPVEARLVFINEVNVIEPPADLPTPAERRAQVRKRKQEMQAKRNKKLG